MYFTTVFYFCLSKIHSLQFFPNEGRKFRPYFRGLGNKPKCTDMSCPIPWFRFREAEKAEKRKKVLGLFLQRLFCPKSERDIHHGSRIFGYYFAFFAIFANRGRNLLKQNQFKKIVYNCLKKLVKNCL